jgi:hypothetical protein
LDVSTDADRSRAEQVRTLSRFRCLFLSDHPGLDLGRLAFAGELQRPIGVDQLVAKVEVETVESVECLVISCDAVWPDEHEKVGPFIGSAARGFECDALLHNSATHLGLDFLTCNAQGGDSFSVGMKNQSRGGTLQIHGRAIIAVFAAIRYDGIGLLLSLAESFQILERSFQSAQLARQPLHLLAGALRFLV